VATVHIYLAYADLLWEKNTIRSLKNTAEVVQQNKALEDKSYARVAQAVS
jgi:hypothetical protein